MTDCLKFFHSLLCFFLNLPSGFSLSLRMVARKAMLLHRLFSCFINPGRPSISCSVSYSFFQYGVFHSFFPSEGIQFNMDGKQVLSPRRGPEVALVYYTLHLELSVTMKISCLSSYAGTKQIFKLLPLSLVLVWRIV